MNFFNKQTLHIDSVSIPDFDWNNFNNEKDIKQWVNEEQTIVLSINFFNAKPDIPSTKNLDALRFFYRDQLSKQKGGIIQVDTIDLKGYKAVKTVFKVQLEEKKMIYLASLTIPFRNCSYVIKIQAAEVGTTGVRESVLGLKLLNEGKIRVDENGYVGWSADPYDPNFNEGVLMTLAEKGLYDLEFPDHPLTQARTLIRRIESGIEFSDEVAKAKAFKY